MHFRDDNPLGLKKITNASLQWVREDMYTVMNTRVTTAFFCYVMKMLILRIITRYAALVALMVALPVARHTHVRETPPHSPHVSRAPSTVITIPWTLLLRCVWCGLGDKVDHQWRTHAACADLHRAQY